MNFETSKAQFSQRFFIRKQKEPSRVVWPNVVQMGRNRVDSASEIHVHWKVDFLYVLVGLGDLQF